MNRQPGSSVYTAFIKDLLDAQTQRKDSIEKRGLAVITTAGTLVTLLFGLAALVTGVEGYTVPGGARSWLYSALVAFFLAALAGIATNAPLLYKGVKPDSLRSATRERWDDDEKSAQKMVAATYVKLFASAKTLNSIKAWLLVAAMALEVIAVLFVALAIRIILIHS